LIHVDDTVQQVATQSPIKLRQLDETERAKVDYIDAAIEPVAARLVGEMFEIKLSHTTMEVVHALKQRWEAGGWCVGVFNLSDSVTQVVFAKPKSGPTAKAITKALEARPKSEVESVIGRAPETPRLSTPLLLRMPTRGRPAQALAVLTAYRELAADLVAIEVVIDEDDGTMNTTQVLQRLYDLDCFITIDRHSSKIEAVNAGRVNDWAILALVSDDMAPVVRGYDRRIQQAMAEHFPLLDGLIYFNDGYNKDHVRPGRPVLCTLPIFGRHLYDQFGYVYFPRYGSLYSDDEQTELLTAMRRAVFVDELLIEHRHHAAGKATNDALYQFNDSKWGEHDRDLFERRSQSRDEHSQFAFGAPPLWLSILVCSTEARANRLRKLVDYLRHQMRAFPRQVELCVSVDDGTLSIGEKRQQLLERAVGHFVAFVDDDDWVASDYVARIVHAIKADPTVDCCSLWGVLTTDGAHPERFHHSIAYSDWRTNANGLHERCPNHLNAVRRTLALAAGFPSKNFGEDHDFSRVLRPMLAREAKIDGVLYHYWARTKKELGA
jgi:hypothetical protein